MIPHGVISFQVHRHKQRQMCAQRLIDVTFYSQCQSKSITSLNEMEFE